MKTIEETAKYLAKEYATDGINIQEVIWYPDEDTIQVVVVTPEAPTLSEDPLPFKFSAHPPEVPYPAVSILLNPRDWERVQRNFLNLPKDWVNPKILFRKHDVTVISLDIETTGLSAQECPILEVAALAVNAEFQIVDTFHMVAHFDLENTKIKVPPEVVEMHQKNGLWDECKASQHSEGNVLAALETFLSKYSGASPLGRGVGTFDRPFIETRRPGTTAALSYRNMDLRSIMRLDDYVPGLCFRDIQPDSNHRAYSDVAGDLEIFYAIVTRLRELVSATEGDSTRVLAKSVDRLADMLRGDCNDTNSSLKQIAASLSNFSKRNTTNVGGIF